MILDGYINEEINEFVIEMIENDKNYKHQQETCKTILIILPTPKNEQIEDKKQFIEDSIKKTIRLV